MKRDCVTVFTGQLARHLLRKGYQIVDIKPDKQDPDNKKSLFIFKNENDLEEVIRNSITLQ